MLCRTALAGQCLPSRGATIRQSLRHDHHPRHCALRRRSPGPRPPRTPRPGRRRGRTGIDPGLGRPADPVRTGRRRLRPVRHLAALGRGRRRLRPGRPRRTRRPGGRLVLPGRHHRRGADRLHDGRRLPDDQPPPPGHRRRRHARRAPRPEPPRPARVDGRPTRPGRGAPAGSRAGGRRGAALGPARELPPVRAARLVIGRRRRDRTDAVLHRLGGGSAPDRPVQRSTPSAATGDRCRVRHHSGDLPGPRHGHDRGPGPRRRHRGADDRAAHLLDRLGRPGGRGGRGGAAHAGRGQRLSHRGCGPRAYGQRPVTDDGPLVPDQPGRLRRRDPRSDRFRRRVGRHRGDHPGVLHPGGLRRLHALGGPDDAGPPAARRGGRGRGQLAHSGVRREDRSPGNPGRRRRRRRRHARRPAPYPRPCGNHRRFRRAVPKAAGRSTAPDCAGRGAGSTAAGRTITAGWDGRRAPGCGRRGSDSRAVRGRSRPHPRERGWSRFARR